MNLVDTLTGGVIFALVSMASLQIHGSSLRATGGLEQLRERDAAMDLLLAQVQRELERRAQELSTDAGPEPTACEGSAAQLLDAIVAALPSSTPAGASVQLEVEESLLKATAQAPELPLRRRWFNPAAYGLCGNPAVETPLANGQPLPTAPPHAQPSAAAAAPEQADPVPDHQPPPPP